MFIVFTSIQDIKLINTEMLSEEGLILESQLNKAIEILKEEFNPIAIYLFLKIVGSLLRCLIKIIYIDDKLTKKLNLWWVLEILQFMIIKQ